VSASATGSGGYPVRLLESGRSVSALSASVEPAVASSSRLCCLAATQSSFLRSTWPTSLSVEVVKEKLPARRQRDHAARQTCCHLISSQAGRQAFRTREIVASARREYSATISDETNPVNLVDYTYWKSPWGLCSHFAATKACSRIHSDQWRCSGRLFDGQVVWIRPKAPCDPLARGRSDVSFLVGASREVVAALRGQAAPRSGALLVSDHQFHFSDPPVRGRLADANVLPKPITTRLQEGKRTFPHSHSPGCPKARRCGIASVAFNRTRLVAELIPKSTDP